MGTIVVVHGAGVRQDGIDQLEQDVRNGLATVEGLAGLTVTMCPYGPAVGVKPVGIADILPPEVVDRAIGAPPDEDDLAAARWSLLADDPLFELRVAAAGARGAGGPSGTTIVIGAALPTEEIAATLQAVTAVDDLPWQTAGIRREEFVAAVNLVAGSPELRNGATAVGNATEAEFIDAVARAIVAVIIHDHRHDAPGTHPAIVTNGRIRDEFVEAVATRLVPIQDRAFGIDWLKGQLAGFVGRRATTLAADHRLAAQSGASLVVGDVLHYLRRPAEMASFVRTCLVDAQPPVIALGHSLGGIILMDVLSASDAPHVDLLVTVGSQSPMLFAYDALGRARGGGPAGLPYSADRPPFTPWLNIYNRNDFVSFRAADIFRNELALTDLDIVDHELHLPEAFPAAHGAYWTDPWTFRFIAERIAAIPAFAHG